MKAVPTAFGPGAPRDGTLPSPERQSLAALAGRLKRRVICVAVDSTRAHGCAVDLLTPGWRRRLATGAQ